MSEPRTATQFILRGLLLPFSRENLLLSYKPGLFFHELSKISGHREQTLRTAFSRAKQSGLIEVGDDALLRLTAKGRFKAAPFNSEKLTHKGKLLVIFDIPVSRGSTRRDFRQLLKNLGFKQVQQSVWVTDFDRRAIVIEAITEYNLDGFVEFYEAARLHPK